MVARITGSSTLAISLGSGQRDGLSTSITLPSVSVMLYRTLGAVVIRSDLNGRQNHRLLDLGDLARIRPARRIIYFDHAAIRQCDVVSHARSGCDQVRSEWSPESPAPRPWRSRSDPASATDYLLRSRCHPSV